MRQPLHSGIEYMNGFMGPSRSDIRGGFSLTGLRLGGRGFIGGAVHD